MHMLTMLDAEAQAARVRANERGHNMHAVKLRVGGPYAHTTCKTCGATLNVTVIPGVNPTIRVTGAATDTDCVGARV